MEAFPPPEPRECAICEENTSEIIHSTDHSIIIWGAGSYGSATKQAHVMVCPRRHVAEIGDLSGEEMVDVMRCCCLAARAGYAAWYKVGAWPVHLAGPKSSYNLGFNFGPHSDDFIPGTKGQTHLHIHVVPRNPNDTNFMWWTTKASILHLRDNEIRPKLVEELQRRTSREPVTDNPEGNLPAAPGGADSRANFEPFFDFTEPEESACPLCKETGDLMESELGRVLFSVKPYKVGHVMVIPRRHVATLEKFTPQEMVEAGRLISVAAKVACEATGTKSYSVGINVGPHSGASIPSHCHIHIVPRFALDNATSFWPRAEACFGTLYAPPRVREYFNKAISSDLEKPSGDRS